MFFITLRCIVPKLHLKTRCTFSQTTPDTWTFHLYLIIWQSFPALENPHVFYVYVYIQTHTHPNYEMNWPRSITIYAILLLMYDSQKKHKCWSLSFFFYPMKHQSLLSPLQNSSIFLSCNFQNKICSQHHPIQPIYCWVF